MRSLEAECSTSVQQQSTSSTGVQRSKLGGHSELEAFGTVGVRNWGRNRAVKTNRLVTLSVISSGHRKVPVCMSNTHTKAVHFRRSVTKVAIHQTSAFLHKNTDHEPTSVVCVTLALKSQQEGSNAPYCQESGGG